MGLFALLGLALKRLVNGLPESIPELLFLFTIEHHALRLRLPALLQALDRINAQEVLSA